MILGDFGHKQGLCEFFFFLVCVCHLSLRSFGLYMILALIILCILGYFEF